MLIALKGNSIPFAKSTERTGLLRRFVTVSGRTRPGAAGGTLYSHYAVPVAHRYWGHNIGRYL